MQNIFNQYKILAAQKSFFLQLITSVALFVLSLSFNYYANNYTATHIGTPISDLILDHIPTFKVDDIFYEGGLLIAAFVAFLSLTKPRRIPFVLKSVGVFFCVRSFFLILTHLSPPLHAATLPTSNFLERLVSGSGDDLFFSGHTGFPFLMALLFWQNKNLKIIFVVATLIFAGAALLGHLHYSIDVFSAFFITYGIYQISSILFKTDKQLFLG